MLRSGATPALELAVAAGPAGFALAAFLQRAAELDMHAAKDEV
jgi:hypothetical protein